MARTKGNLERTRAGSSFPPMGASERKKPQKMRKSGQILLTKKKRQSIFSLSMDTEDKSDQGLEIRSDTLLPNIHLRWQFESGDFDSVETHALARVINILKALGHDDESVDIQLLTSEKKDHEGSKRNLGEKTSASTHHPSKPPKVSSLLIDLTGDDDMKQVPQPFKSGDGVTLKDWPVSDGKERAFTMTSHEQGSSSRPQPKKTQGFNQPSKYRDPYDDQLAKIDQKLKIAKGFTEVRGRAVEEDLNLQLDSDGREHSLLQVDEIFHGPNWKSLDERLRVRTILEQFRYLQDLFTEHGMKKGPGRRGRGPTSRMRATWQAGIYMRTKGYCFNESFSVEGAIPGIAIGDSFVCRQELFLLLIHRQPRGGIDFIPASHNKYLNKDGISIAVAVSVVVSGGYSEDEYYGNTLIYTGQGGHHNRQRRRGDREKDQELVRGNLALKNSCDYGVPVRVTLREAKGKNYVYMGLFDVNLYYQEPSESGFKLWKFRLVKQRRDQEPYMLGGSIDSA